MSALPSTPWTSIEDFRVAVDAPVSQDLMTDIVVDLNYLKSTLSDGLTAAQDILANNLEVAGNALFDGDVDIDGTLRVGAFFSSNDLLFL